MDFSDNFNGFHRYKKCFILESNFPLVDVKLNPLQPYGLKGNVKPLSLNQFIFRQANKKKTH